MRYKTDYIHHLIAEILLIFFSVYYFILLLNVVDHFSAKEVSLLILDSPVSSRIRGDILLVDKQVPRSVVSKTLNQRTLKATHDFLLPKNATVGLLFDCCSKISSDIISR